MKFMSWACWTLGASTLLWLCLRRLWIPMAFDNQIIESRHEMRAAAYRYAKAVLIQRLVMWRSGMSFLRSNRRGPRCRNLCLWISNRRLAERKSIMSSMWLWRIIEEFRSSCRRSPTKQVAETSAKGLWGSLMARRKDWWRAFQVLKIKNWCRRFRLRQLKPKVRYNI